MSPWVRQLFGPLLLAQADSARRRAPPLPEAEGPRAGVLGRAGLPPLRLLIAGDSSAAGVGVATQDLALAGYLTRELQARTNTQVSWVLHAQAGITTGQVLTLLQGTTLAPADVAVVVSGVNDLIEQVPPGTAQAERAALVAYLRAHAGVRHVVFTALPPVHQFPLLRHPLKFLAGQDAKHHNSALAAWAAQREDASYVQVQVRLSTANMAADGFHPGEPVYRLCGERVAAHIATQLWPRLLAQAGATQSQSKEAA